MTAFETRVWGNFQPIDNRTNEITRENIMKKLGVALGVLAALLAIALLVGPMQRTDLTPRTEFVLDGRVYCDPVPDEIARKASKSTVDGSIVIMKSEFLKGSVSISDEQVNARFSAIPIKRADYMVLQRSLCLEFASGAISKEDYVRFKERILPILERRVEKESRFDAQFRDIKIIDLDNKRRLEVTIDLVPLTTDNTEVASIVYGMVVVHDETKLSASAVPEQTLDTCEDRKITCLGAEVRAMPDQPIVVRGGANRIPVKFRLDLRTGEPPRAVRIYWDFYQLESDGGGRCVIDSKKKHPKDGIPFLHVVGRGQEPIDGAQCYRAIGTETVTL